MIRAVLALLFLLACLACATPASVPSADPSTNVSPAPAASPPAQATAPEATPPRPATIRQVTIVGATLPKDCIVAEHSGIQVKPPLWAGLLWCKTKPVGVEPVAPAPTPEVKPETSP